LARYRIFYLIGQLGIGGAERQLVHLVTQLDRSRFEPIVCSLSADTALAQDLHAAGVDPVVLPKRMSPDITRLWRVVQVVRRHRPSLIHSYLFVANTWARTTGLLCRLPVIVSERSVQERGNRFHALIDRMLAPATTLMVANSHAGGNLAVRSGRITRDRLAVVHNGISVAAFSGRSLGEGVRSEFGFGSREPVIGIVGRLAEEKGHRMFFDAMALVARALPDVRILCVGDGPLRDSLHERVRQLGLHDRTIFTGLRSDIPAIMSALTLLVLSSLREACPNVVMEAMAAGRPVVATRVGDLEELVVHDKTGFLVPPANPDLLARRVLSLLRDRSMAERMGQCAKARVERYFTLERMVTATQNLYSKLLSPGTGNTR